MGKGPGSLWPLFGKGSEKVSKVIEKGTQNEGIFNDFLSFDGKWQTAFGPRRLDRIGLQAPCFRPWGFLGASGGDAFSKACSRSPPRRGPESHFGFALEIFVD